MRSAPELAVAEPKRLRYRICTPRLGWCTGNAAAGCASPFHLAVATQISTAFTRIAAIPAPGLTQLSPTPTSGGPKSHAHRRDRRPLTSPSQPGSIDKDNQRSRADQADARHESSRLSGGGARCSLRSPAPLLGV